MFIFNYKLYCKLYFILLDFCYFEYFFLRVSFKTILVSVYCYCNILIIKISFRKEFIFCKLLNKVVINKS